MTRGHTHSNAQAEIRAKARKGADKELKKGGARNPRGPRDHHQQQGGEGEPWDRPVPLDRTVLVDPFPVEVLPPGLKEFVCDAAAAKACPVDFVGVPLLVLAGAAIGASRVLQVKPGYCERPALYAAIIGEPGSAKSPALKTVARPVYDEQARLLQNYQAAKKAWQRDELGEKPTLSTVYVSDITTERLGGVLQENPRGVALVRDELSAWVAGMDQYKARGKGSDRQFYLQAWAGEPVSVHRKNQEDGPVFVAHPFLGVVGCLPPDLLDSFRDRKVSDGFLDRLLFAFPDPAPVVGETWNCIRDEAAESWKATLDYLWALQPEEDEHGNPRPRYARLTRAGQEQWQALTQELADEMNAEGFPGVLRGPWSKLRGYGARLALIVHYLWAAAGHLQDLRDSRDHSQKREGEVDGEDVGRAAALLKVFMSHARRVYSCIDGDKGAEKAQRVLDWIRREKKTSFKAWEPYQDIKCAGLFPSVDSLDEPLRRLEQHNYIRQAPAPPRRGPGRPPAALYEVNPLLGDGPENPVNPANGSAVEEDEA